MIVKHLYPREISKNGKRTKIWYFWFYDKNGKRVRRSTGQSVKRNAEIFLANLSDEDLCPELKTSITLADFANGMFDEGSKYLIKQKNKGFELSETSRKNYKYYLEKVILPKWGDFKPDIIEPVDIENWLLEFNHSPHWKNQVILVFEKIYTELYAYKVINRLPRFMRFKTSKSKRGILTKDEIYRLFPIEYEKTVEIWRLKQKSEVYSYMLATMCYFSLTMGLRRGEVRAIHADQINGNTLLLNRMIDGNGVEVDHLKKGNDENKKWRVCIIPDKALKMLEIYKTVSDETSSDYLFSEKGKPINETMFCCFFQQVLKNNGIDYKVRHLSIHSLRYTCNTMMRHHIDENILRLLIGHTSQTMTDYYDKPTLEMQTAVVESQRDAINRIW